MRQLTVVVTSATLAALVGCNSLLGIGELELAGDGGVPDAPPGTLCHGTLVEACLPPPSPGDVPLAGTLDTGLDPRCVVVTQPIGVDVCALHAESFSIAPGGLTVLGARPLMLVATSSIEIGARVEVSAGSNPAVCASPGTGAGSDQGGGGGAGGTLGSSGGVGGKGGGGSGGSGARVTAVAPIVGLRGGCAGSAGGGGNSATLGVGAGGDGGGALYLVARASIVIRHRVDASGRGGLGATGSRSGGGGGGSGGMIALEAPMITLDGAEAQVFANGGGGGEGATLTIQGDDGDASVAWDRPGPGGAGLTALGGDGGGGATRSAMAGPGAQGTVGGSNQGGGGGGGGGVGVVRTLGTLTGSAMNQISPAP